MKNKKKYIVMCTHTCISGGEIAAILHQLGLWWMVFHFNGDKGSH